MKRTAICLAVSALSISPLALAGNMQDTPVSVSAISANQLENASVDDLKKIILALSNRVDSMETQTTELRGIATAKPASSWADKVTWNGDFRYRYESIDNDRTDEDRNRSRVRARIGMTAQVADDIKAGIALASGSDDPVSSNQTLGGGGSSKGINLDMAYIDWKFAENLHLVAGKTKNPYYSVGKNGLVWDGDYRPEGAHVSFDNGTFWAIAGYHFLESDNNGGSKDAEEMMGAQIGYNGKISDNTKFKVGASYFYIPVEGSDAFFDGETFGNSSYTRIVDDNDTPLDFSDDETANVHEFDYETVELFAELNTKIAGIKTTFFADYVKNSDADEDTGFSLGMKLGSAKNAGDWQFGYTYEDLEADAVFATFTDSDFGGGGTDVKGHKLNAAYAFSKNTSLSVTYFDNEYGEYTRTEELDFDRLQLDLKTKF
ncbi:MAG: putative porin [Porticoccus sp.]|nr:putative porin [Porticoccus sp.]